MTTMNVDGWAFRTGITTCTCDTSHADPEPVPDPYAVGIAKLRAAQGIEINEITDDDPRLRAIAEFRDAYWATVMASRFAAMAPATSDVYASPPDGYSIALAQSRESV